MVGGWDTPALLTAFQAPLLPVFPCHELLFEPLRHLEHGRRQSVIAGGSVDIGTGHSQVHGGAECGRRVPLVFQHHLGQADGDEPVQMFQVLL